MNIRRSDDERISPEIAQRLLEEMNAPENKFHRENALRAMLSFIEDGDYKAAGVFMWANGFCAGRTFRLKEEKES